MPGPRTGAGGWPGAADNPGDSSQDETFKGENGGADLLVMTGISLAQPAAESGDGASFVPGLALVVGVGVLVLSLVGYRKARRRGEPTGRALRLALVHALPAGGLVFGGVFLVVAGAVMLWAGYVFWTELSWLFSPVAFILVIGMVSWILEVALVVGGATLVVMGISMIFGGGTAARSALREPRVPEPLPTAALPPPPPPPPPPSGREPNREATGARRSSKPRRERPLRAAGR